MKMYNAREYRWWLKRNSHFCGFCLARDGGEAIERDLNHPGRLGLQCLNRRKGKGQWSNGYWQTMKGIFARHIGEHHPEVKITEAK